MPPLAPYSLSGPSEGAARPSAPGRPQAPPGPDRERPGGPRPVRLGGGQRGVLYRRRFETRPGAA